MGLLGVIPVFVALVTLTISGHDLHEEEQEYLADTNNVVDSIFSVINKDYQTVRPILVESCFDCHSDQTQYPWYHALPVVGSMIDDHIKDGREHLDLSNDFPFSGKGVLPKRLQEMKDEIEEDGMPIWGYQLLHWGSAIEGEERDSLFAWIDRSIERLNAADSAYSLGETEDH